MFVAVYRWRLRAGQEDRFREGWSKITKAARDRCGSGGSALFREADGTWCAVARWPSREAREACFGAGPLDTEARAMMRDAIEESLPGLELEMDTDLWAPLPAPQAHQAIP